MTADDFTLLKTARLAKLQASQNLSRLFSELLGREYTPDVERINSLISAETLAFYAVMREDGGIVGMASVIPCRTALCDKLWIEDVCLLSEYRGRGLGRRLMEFVLADAAEYFNGGTFYLTSRPSRVAARALYKSLGFTECETGVFKR